MKSLAVSGCHVALLLALASVPAVAASSSPAYMPGLAALGPLWMYWLCNSQRQKSIGGWLLYFYIQIYLALAVVFLMFTVSTLPHLNSNHWHDQTAFALYTLKSILPVVMVSSETVIASILLKKRDWMLVNVLRGLFVADLLAGLFSLAVDWKYWPGTIVPGILALAWPSIWLGYFSYSNRVKRVFRTHDWCLAAVPRAVSQSRPEVPETGVEVRFFLKPEELDKAVVARRVASNKPNNKIAMRAVCGAGAFYLAYLPYKWHGSWSNWFHDEPAHAALLGALLVLDVWIALGQFGVTKLNRLANRLDLERRICMSNHGVDISHGRMRHRKKWQDFSFFQETPTLIMLQTVGTSFWTLPKRAIPADRADQLRALLAAKLPQQ